MENKLTPPTEVLRKFTLTYDELLLLLRTYGTHVAVRILELERSENPTTYHTDIVTEPAAHQWIGQLEKSEELEKEVIEEIPMLSHLLDLVDDNKLEGEWFTYYPTPQHKEQKLQWWGPRQEIILMAEERTKRLRYIFYGK